MRVVRNGLLVVFAAAASCSRPEQALDPLTAQTQVDRSRTRVYAGPPPEAGKLGPDMPHGLSAPDPVVPTRTPNRSDPWSSTSTRVNSASDFTQVERVFSGKPRVASPEGTPPDYTQK